MLWDGEFSSHLTSCGAVSDGGSSVPETAASPSSVREEEQTSRKENIDDDDDDDDDDDINLDDPKYQQKPDWMEDEVWESINNERMLTLPLLT